MSDERYRELPNMLYCGSRVGHVGALDIFFLRTARIIWDDLEAAIVVRAGEPARINLDTDPA
ncbi:MAG TPA: hypothetical protein VGP89_18010 [Candidatus Angelobacter sp.]|jgi:hypothetical protein|nr:hypothetical protein [Candidatus Angelobacter sp.]